MSPRLYRCCRCKLSKPLAEFPPSRAYRVAWCRQCLREYKTVRSVRSCSECGVLMVVTPRQITSMWAFCSRGCKNHFRNDLERHKRRENRRKKSQTCVHCGTALDASKRADARYCSDTCGEAARNATRKAAMKIGLRQQYVSRRFIYDRDHGTCHLCGERRPFDDFHLDHITPLARGGTHTADNLAVACPSCNMSKGARILERQMTLT